MFNKIKKAIFSKEIALTGVVMAAGAEAMVANTAHAAADPDFTNALASSSSIVTDNLGGILGYILNIWGKGFLIGLLLAVLGLTAAIVIGAIFRRRKGKR